MGNLHANHPYHRVKWFNGAFYEDAWLRDAGVYLSLCRNPVGLACPSATHRPELPDAFYQSAPPRPFTATCDISEEDQCLQQHPFDAEQAEFGEEPDDFAGRRDPPPQPPRAPTRGGLPTHDHRGLKVLIVCDDNAMHGLGVHFCSCSGAPPKDMQLIERGIYPASRKDPSSGFTFRCLQRFLVDNLESDTTAESYARKLARLTEPENPEAAPVRLPHPFAMTY